MALQQDESQILPYTHMSHEELERQYSPSRWSKRFNENDIIQKHVEVAKKYSEEARRNVIHRCGIQYDNEDLKIRPRATLDVYGENLPSDRPILAYVHGGYWQELNKDLSAYLVQPLYDNDVITVVIGYTLAPEVGVIDIVEEIRSAVNWVCNLAQKRGSRHVVLAGWSAGAQLVTQVLSTWSTDKYKSIIKGIVTFSGIFDLRPLVSTYVNDPLKLTPKEATELSPMYKVEEIAKLWPKLSIKICVGDCESDEFKRQSTQYTDLLVKEGMHASLLQVQNNDHFNIVENLAFLTQGFTQQFIKFVNTFQ